MQIDVEPVSPRIFQRVAGGSSYLLLALGVLVVLGSVYLLQLFSPLRLNMDASYLLEVATSAVNGHGFVTIKGEPSRYPPGYPALVAGLDLVGLGSSWALIALNCAFIAFGLTACYFLFQRVFAFERWIAVVLCCLTLLSFVLVKHVTLPQTDVPFFGATLASLFMLATAERAEGVRRWRYLALAGLLAAGAFLIRPIGIAFVPALLWAIIAGLGLRKGWSSWSASRRGLLVLAGAGMVLALGYAAYLILRIDGLMAWLLANYTGEGAFKTLGYIMYRKLLELGELILNVPGSRLPAFATVMLFVIGLIGMGMVVYGGWIRRASFGAVEVFMLAYLAILFLWPGYGSRLWLPVIPLVMAWMSQTLQEGVRWKGVRVATALYLVWFFFTGSAALAYSSRISLADPATFIERFGDGKLRTTYRVAFMAEEADPDDVMERILRVLLRYESRVHPCFSATPPCFIVAPDALIPASPPAPEVP